MAGVAPLAVVARVAGVVLASAGLALAGVSMWTAALASGRTFTPETVPARDVAVIFGAEVYANGTPAPFTAARLDVGEQLYRAGTVRVLLVSGNNAVEHNRETTAMRRYLEGKGVPAARIVEDEAGEDTYDTCIRLRDVFGVRDPVLVTQAYHLPRALATARSLGLDAVGVGDSSVADRDFWPVGVAREYPARVKMAADLLRRRPPAVTSPPSGAVAEALKA
ncbi:MAG TPA: hypothetical protein DEG88_02130 [Propionibacteriaceae bacterium]|jgi:vancomycin permeability regulator SanA|nr:hypothetical protein [Propionibacteriaceae bacterium]HBY22126.1 hypothetical protein [Propionibacteriaceae bacterium]